MVMQHSDASTTMKLTLTTDEELHQQQPPMTVEYLPVSTVENMDSYNNNYREECECVTRSSMAQLSPSKKTVQLLFHHYHDLHESPDMIAEYGLQFLKEEVVLASASPQFPEPYDFTNGSSQHVEERLQQEPFTILQPTPIAYTVELSNGSTGGENSKTTFDEETHGTQAPVNGHRKSAQKKRSRKWKTTARKLITTMKQE